MSEGVFLIWSIEHTAWWNPNWQGYTHNYSTAGRYTKKEAFDICNKANWRSLNEVPVPAEFFDKDVEKK